VLNTIVAEALDELTDQLETAVEGGTALEEAVPPVLQRSYAANKQIVFNGDNYTDEWEKEAEQRGLLNLRQTPDALPMITTPETVETFSTYKVLSERELEARLEVYFEHYIIQLNIEGETAARIARTMLLPAALRHLALLHAAGGGDAIARLSGAVSETIEEFVYAIETLESVNDTHPEGADPAAGARYMSDTVIPAMEGVREVADRLEHLVAADLWPLPSYSEMLFVK
jgi:glutamine synthetase